MATIVRPTLAGRITLLLVPLFLHIPAYSLDPTSNCPASNCGNVNISYPFWVLPSNSSNPETFCGYRELNVTCNSRDNMPAIRTLLGNYTIKTLNESARALTLLHPDAAVTGHGCSRVKRSFTLQAAGIRFLEYTTKVVNLTFFYNCYVKNEKQILKEYQICSNWENTTHSPTKHPFRDSEDDGGNHSYVFIDTAVNPTYAKLYNKCEEVMVAPVMRSAVDGKSLPQAFADALQGGFELTWDIGGVGSCISCEFSGGRCGGNNWMDVDDDRLCLCEGYTAERDNCSRTGMWLYPTLLFSTPCHPYNTLASNGYTLIVSIHYRHATEHLLPATYDVYRPALQWVLCHGATDGPDPWFIVNGDLGPPPPQPVSPADLTALHVAAGGGGWATDGEQW